MKMELNNHLFTFDDAGRGEPVLVLLHGFPLNRRIWEEQAKALAKRCRVIVPDLRGHGETPVSPGAATMDRLADDVAGLLDRLGIADVVLGGLSMGGYVAFAFLRRYRERVKGLLLVNTRSEADTAEGKENRLEMIKLVEEKGAEVVASGLIEKVLGATTLNTKPALVARVREMMTGTPVEGIRNVLLGMAERPDSTPDLHKIDCPSLVIGGEEDTLTPVEMARDMARRIPRSTLKVIPRAGHLSPVENPEAVTEAIESFLAGLAM